MLGDPAGEVFATAQTGDGTSLEAKRHLSEVPPPVNLEPSYDRVDHVSLRQKGFLDRLTIIDRVNTPLEHGTSTKWMITFIVACSAAVDPLSSTIFYPALPELATYFGISPTIANLSVALSFLPTAVCPLWWSFLSENRGRRMTLIISLALCLVFNMLSAKSSSIGMLIAMRLLSSGTGCAVTAVGAGIIADIWEVKTRGKAMGIFYLGPLLGPALGPVIGGALTLAWGWRATQWFLAIISGTCLLVIFFFLPETLRSVDNNINDEHERFQLENDPGANHSQDIQSQSFRHRFQCGGSATLRKVFGPLRILVYLRFFAILLPVYMASVSFGTLAIRSVSLQAAFSKPPYDYSAFIIGLLFLPYSMGLIVASILGGRWSDYIMLRSAKRAGRVSETGDQMTQPEDRVRENAWLSIGLFSGGLLWYGWTVEYGVLWIVPMCANFFIGAGSMLVFHPLGSMEGPIGVMNVSLVMHIQWWVSGEKSLTPNLPQGLTTTMLTELVPSKSASAIAVNALGRNLSACIGAVVAQPLMDAVGQGWLFTGLSIIILAGSGVIWAMRRFGESWRMELRDGLAR